ncbi:MAG: DNA methyltransferase [Patescibacteria group bacterium]|nr:DNA methyltransferase [Patescibacteria group bacterium]
MLSSDEQAVLVDIMQDHDEVVALFGRLGGFVKVGYVIEDVTQYLDQFIKDHSEVDTKVNFSLSFYNDGKFRILKQKRKALGMQTKKYLKSNGIRSRFVSNPSDLKTSSVLLRKNKVIRRGFELNLLQHPKSRKEYWGLTLAVQDYGKFSHIDYGRPRANKKRGMIPPKLARMMLNLAQVVDDGVIWDPFCGSGTILMEGLLAGYRVVGSDVDKDAIEETKENLAWLCEDQKISHTKYEVMEHDLQDGIPKDLKFDAIVTEPYLGPVLRNVVTVEQVASFSETIDSLYDALVKIVLAAPSKGKLVVVVPAFKTISGWIDLDFAPARSSSLKDVSSELSTQPLQWDRPDSIIRRNIKIFKY